VAQALQKHSRTDTLIIDQDYYRHTLLANKPDEKNAEIIKLIQARTKL
jgi:hypothetical protein